jgi:hypothetical protein
MSSKIPPDALAFVVQSGPGMMTTSLQITLPDKLAFLRDQIWIPTMQIRTYRIGEAGRTGCPTYADSVVASAAFPSVPFSLASTGCNLSANLNALRLRWSALVRNRSPRRTTDRRHSRGIELRRCDDVRPGKAGRAVAFIPSRGHQKFGEVPTPPKLDRRHLTWERAFRAVAGRELDACLDHFERFIREDAVGALGG